MHEVLLYGLIYSFSSQEFIKAINEVEGDNLTVRVNTGGGDVLYGYGMIAKFKEFEGNKLVKVDGAAYSMGAFFTLFSDNVEAYDVSKFMFHRAAYDAYYEENYMTESVRGELAEMNKDLEKAFRNKIDVPKFEALKGVKVKDLFSMDSRIDVFLNAKEAKQIGLISKINKLTPDKSAKMAESINRIAANFSGYIPELPKAPLAEQEEQIITDNNINSNKMTVEEFKKANPEAYAAIVATGEKSGIEKGIAQERDRVGAWNAYAKADPDAVKAGIASGKNITETDRSEFAVKLATAGAIGKLNGEGKETPGAEAAGEEIPTEKTAGEKLEAKIKAEAGIPETK